MLVPIPRSCTVKDAGALRNRHGTLSVRFVQQSITLAARAFSACDCKAACICIPVSATPLRRVYVTVTTFQSLGRPQPPTSPYPPVPCWRHATASDLFKNDQFCESSWNLQVQGAAHGQPERLYAWPDPVEDPLRVLRRRRRLLFHPSRSFRHPCPDEPLSSSHCRPLVAVSQIFPSPCCRMTGLMFLASPHTRTCHLTASPCSACPCGKNLSVAANLAAAIPIAALPECRIVDRFADLCRCDPARRSRLAPCICLVNRLQMGTLFLHRNSRILRLSDRPAPHVIADMGKSLQQ